MSLLVREGPLWWLLLGCTLWVSGCGEAHTGKDPSALSRPTPMCPVDFAFTGFSAGPSPDYRDGPVGFVREALYYDGDYREARERMEANGLGRFGSMVLLYIGGDEHTFLVWAFEYDGRVNCLTSLPAHRVTADACTHSGARAQLATSVALPSEIYRQSLDGLLTHARKGDYTAGSTETMLPGGWLHVVAYDRDKEWFLRATTVDAEMIRALDMIMALGVFSPGKSGHDVITRSEQDLNEADAFALPEDTAEDAFGDKVTRKDIFGEETNIRDLLKRVDENWSKCLPFLTAMYFVWPMPFPLDKEDPESSGDEQRIFGD